MTRAPAAVFTALVVATFGAFFVAQRLKHEPTLIQRFRATAVFSPRQAPARVSFVVKRSDDVTLSVVNSTGDVVRELLTTTTHHDGERVRARWNGRDDDGRIVPDGTYRYLIILSGEGRSIVYPRDVRVDGVPPRPRIASVGDAAGGAPHAEVLPRPDGSPVPIVVDGRGTDLHVSVVRTAPDPAVVADLAVPPADGAGGQQGFWTRPVRVSWDGRDHGAPARPGTYVVVASVRDRAGNVGHSVPVDRNGLPVAGYRSTLPGRAGITVRYAAVAPPAVAIAAGRSATLAVDTRRAAYRWTLRRVGAGGPERSGRREGDGTQRIGFGPRSGAGLYLFRVASASGTARAPVAVDGAGQQPVLVVLPVMTWQGRNPVDDDGDGEPNLLDRGDSVALHRPYAGDVAGLMSLTEPLMAWLEATGKHYDLTTDVALARTTGPALEGHRGVLVAGDARWLPAGVQHALHRYVQAGGKVATTGVDNLRRLVRLAPGDVLADPTPPATSDALGLRPAPLVHGPQTLTIARDDAGLFSGTSGEFTGLTVAEPLEGLRDDEVVSSAVSGDGRTIIAAVRSGQGMTIHLGLPELAARAGAPANDPQAAGLLESMWTLLSR